MRYYVLTAVRYRPGLPCSKAVATFRKNMLPSPTGLSSQAEESYILFCISYLCSWRMYFACLNKINFKRVQLKHICRYRRSNLLACNAVWTWNRYKGFVLKMEAVFLRSICRPFYIQVHTVLPPRRPMSTFQVRVRDGLWGTWNEVLHCISDLSGFEVWPITVEESKAVRRQESNLFHAPPKRKELCRTQRTPSTVKLFFFSTI